MEMASLYSSLCIMVAVGLVDMSRAFSMPVMALKLPAKCPPVVILPGFGNDARDCES